MSQKLVNRKEVYDLIDAVISSLEKDKLVSDKYYSDYKSKSFYKRGYSLNKIRYNLIKKGIDQKYIKEYINGDIEMGQYENDIKIDSKIIDKK